MLSQLITDVGALDSSLHRGHAVNVNDQSSKELAIELATRYFSEIRPRLVMAFGETDLLLRHDELWQQLVRLAHGNNARQTYFSVLRAIRGKLSEFNVLLLSTPSLLNTQSETGTPLSSEDTLILQTLDSIAPNAAASYRQGLADLNEFDRLSYRGTAAEFRESLRETLDQLAPDADVQAEQWYKSEEKQNAPTMKQKVRYILASRQRNKTQRDSAEKTIVLIEELCGEVMRAVYNRASLATHIHQSKTEVQRIKRYVDTIFFDLLEITR